MSPSKVFSTTAIAVLMFSSSVFAVGAQTEYIKKSSWAETMLAYRSALTQTTVSKAPEVSAWYAIDSIPSRNFEDKFFPESGVDITAESPDGKPLWKKHTEWADGHVQNLRMVDNSSIYMYRTIKVDGDRSIRASIGSDDGVKLWLNGSKLLSKNDSHAAAPDQYIVELNLRSGENQLLMKIHNNAAGAAFYFNIEGIRSGFDGLARDLTADFPIEMEWLRQDGPGKMSDWVNGIMDGKGDLATYMSNRDNTDFERGLISNVLSELGSSGVDIRSQLDRLTSAKTGPDDGRWLDLYVKACQKRRHTRLKPLLTATKQIIFAKHPTFGKDSGIYCITENSGGHPKTSLCSLDLTPELAGNGQFATVKTMLACKDGIRDPQVSYDGKRLLFVWRKSGAKPSLNYQIHEMDLATGKIRQLTTDETYGASFEPDYLPNGDIIFSSSRIVQHITCGWGDCSNLFIMNRDGKYARRVGFDQTNTAWPHVLEDGRVIFTRRDYNDRGQVYAHKLFQMNPDGTAQMEYYGNNSFHPTSFQHSRGIPGTEKIITIIGGYHTSQGGKLAEIDLSEGRQEPDGVRLIPSGEKPVMRQTSGDNYGKEGDQYQYPYPVTKDTFLVCYSLAGLLYNDNSSHLRPENEMPYGIYFMSKDGKRELLVCDKDISCLQPNPIMARPVPHSRPSLVDYAKDYSVCSVSDVYQGQSMTGVKRGTIKKIRVVELRYKPLTNGGTVSGGGPGGYGHSVTPIATNSGSYDVKVILGDAKVHADGSARFYVPARVPIFFQALDNRNRVVQTMRSWATPMPNEKLSCVGCHESKQASPPTVAFANEASRSEPQQLDPFYGPPRGFSFIKEIQPILDKNCVSCHSPNGKASKFLLTSEEEIDPTNGDTANPHRRWLKSYRTLTGWPAPSQRYYTGNKLVNWIGRLGAPTLHPPYEAGSAKSEMIDMLESGHNGRVKLSREEMDKLTAWIDLNVPFCGEYDEANTWSPRMKRDYEDRTALRKANEDIERRNIRAFINAGQK